MNRFIRMKDDSSVDLVGVGVIVAIGITIAYLAMQIGPLVSLYRHPPAEVAGTMDQSESAKKFADAIAWDRDQVKGRSLFYIPAKPDEQPTEVAKATRYEGPSLSMFVNGTAFFSDGQKVSAAEPDAKTLHFVSATPPWSVRVRWKGNEFEVPLFEKTQLSSLSSTLSGSGISWGPGFHATPSVTATAGDHPPEKAEVRLGPGADAPPPPPPPGGGPGGTGEPPPGGAPSPPSPAPQTEPAPASGGGGSSPPVQPSPAPAPAPTGAPSGSPSSPPADPPKDPSHSDTVRPNPTP